MTVVDHQAGFMSWLNTTSVGGFVLGGIAVAFTFVRRSMSRNSLDTAQFDSIRQTLDLLRNELQHEQEARLSDLRAGQKREEQLAQDLEKVTDELVSTRRELDSTRKELAKTNDKLQGLQRDFDNMMLDRGV